MKYLNSEMKWDCDLHKIELTLFFVWFFPNKERALYGGTLIQTKVKKEKQQQKKNIHLRILNANLCPIKRYCVSQPRILFNLSNVTITMANS